MVKIAIAGAGGQLAREIIDAFVETGRHEILGLMRKDTSAQPSLPGVTWVQNKFDDKAELVRLLAGVNTVLCFFTVEKDEGARAQKLLIDAAVEAGVPRYIPSEWSMGASLKANIHTAPHYANKLLVREYLADLNNRNNSGKKVLEYTLLWPGLFANYLGFPHKTTAHVSAFEIFMNIDAGVAIAVEGHADARVAFTTMADLSRAVVRIVEYEGEWPVNGGLRGESIRYADLLELATRLRGSAAPPMEVEWVKMEDLEAGRLATKWLPKLDHPAMASGLTEEMSRGFLVGIVRALAVGGWDTSDEWNKLLPDMEFTGLERFLTPLFKGKQ
ncbi:hypothetical protein MAPG_11152 [Magnaporthiopsis poae ATCC 64411]|uniref:NmrA-like domain-containing protein n=1 Tax=Magnaporthiopsis poae (strain ATCC 64411 / 73-15) TaxID=644358 RepID=A0A0C4EEH9_MAGP6|nr:hypothetical protein MAPG_11152 [Magnaporthiopsis poae ATCC 64411]